MVLRSPVHVKEGRRMIRQEKAAVGMVIIISTYHPRSKAKDVLNSADQTSDMRDPEGQRPEREGCSQASSGSTLVPDTTEETRLRLSVIAGRVASEGIVSASIPCALSVMSYQQQDPRSVRWRARALGQDQPP